MQLEKAPDLEPPSPRAAKNRVNTMSYGDAPQEQLAEELASLVCAVPSMAAASGRRGSRRSRGFRGGNRSKSMDIDGHRPFFRLFRGLLARFRCVSEAQPQARHHRLLRSGSVERPERLLRILEALAAQEGGGY